MVTNDIIKLNVIIKLDIDTEVKNQLFHDYTRTLKRKQIYCLIQIMKNPFTKFYQFLFLIKFLGFSFYYLTFCILTTIIEASTHKNH